ncbi:RDD family protein [bacterium]|nr:RDD family protein [bacterium]
MNEGPETIICEVTAQRIPRENAVQFQGKWVGAEGKAILLERLRSGTDEPGSLVTASVALRVSGFIVDGVLFAGIYFAIGYPTGWWMGMVTIEDPAYDPSVQMTLGQAIFQFVMNSFYILYVATMHWRGGRTVGKLVSGTKVVRLNGGELSFRQAFGRSLCSDSLTILESFAILTMVLIELADPTNAPGLQGLFQKILSTMSAVVSSLILVNMVSALVDTKLHRALHDRIAGTRVVRVL